MDELEVKYDPSTLINYTSKKAEIEGLLVEMNKDIDEWLPKHGNFAEIVFKQLKKINYILGSLNE